MAFLRCAETLGRMCKSCVTVVVGLVEYFSSGVKHAYWVVRQCMTQFLRYLSLTVQYGNAQFRTTRECKVGSTDVRICAVCVLKVRLDSNDSSWTNFLPFMEPEFS